MLTRAGAAKRLGKSIATVRRLEGRELFPSVDERGVHRFSEVEVNRLRRHILKYGSVAAAQGGWLLGSTKGGHPVTISVADQVSAARKEVVSTIVELLSQSRAGRCEPSVLEYMDGVLRDEG